MTLTAEEIAEPDDATAPHLSYPNWYLAKIGGDAATTRALAAAGRSRA